jgi:hypothetical protein
LWHFLKQLPPVQEALGLRKPAKPLIAERREEIEELKRQHATARAAFASAERAAAITGSGRRRPAQ